LLIRESQKFQNFALLELLPGIRVFGRIGEVGLKSESTSPSYAFDKHTSIGKAAIGRLASENRAVRAALAAFVAAPKAHEAAAMAAFYADGAPVSLRCDWSGCTELKRLGIEADMGNAGAHFDGIRELLKAVRDNLDHLNALRADLLGRRALLAP